MTFDNMKGLICFAFLNAQNSYLTPALKEVTSDQYIYQELKSAGYEKIIYVTCIPHHVTVRTYDEVSSKFYRKPKFLQKTEYEFRDDSYDALNTKFVSALEKQEKNVVVVFNSPESFYNFRNNLTPQLSLTLPKRGNEWQLNSHSLMVIMCPLSAKASYPYLAGEKALFGKNTVLAGLCSGMDRILDTGAANGENVDLFRAMKKNLGPNCIFPGDFTEEQLKRVFKNYFIQEDKQLLYIEEVVNDLAEICYVWYHSDNMQLHYQNLFETIHEWNMHELQESLPRVMPGLLKEYPEMKKKFPHIPADLKVAYPEFDDPDMEKLPILVDIGIAPYFERLIARMCSKAGCEQGLINRVMAASQELHVVYRYAFSDRVEELLKTAIAAALHAADYEDWNTVDHSMKAIEYCIQSHFLYSDSDEKIWNNWKDIIRCSVECFKQKQNLLLNQEKRAACQKEFDSLKQEVRYYKEVLCLDINKSLKYRNAVLSYRESMDTLKQLDYVIAQTQQVISNLTASIHKMELAAHTFTARDVKFAGQIFKGGAESLSNAIDNIEAVDTLGVEQIQRAVNEEKDFMKTSEIDWNQFLQDLDV